MEAENLNIVKAVCEYTNIFHASVQRGNVFACQFHPEKSGNAGLRILQNFLLVKKPEEKEEE